MSFIVQGIDSRSRSRDDGAILKLSSEDLFDSLPQGA